jgi:hypothetical protein
MTPSIVAPVEATDDLCARHYHLRWTRPVNALLTVFWTILWLVLALASHRTNWPVMGALGACLLVISVWANVVAARAGVYEVEQGIVARSLFGSTLIDWRQVAGFEHRRQGTHDIVYARRTDGSRHRVTHVLQGQRVVWRNGETRDIDGLLNERLKEWQGLSPSR